MNRPKLI